MVGPIAVDGGRTARYPGDGASAEDRVTMSDGGHLTTIDVATVRHPLSAGTGASPPGTDLARAARRAGRRRFVLALLLSAEVVGVLVMSLVVWSVELADPVGATLRRVGLGNGVHPLPSPQRRPPARVHGHRPGGARRAGHGLHDAVTCCTMDAPGVGATVVGLPLRRQSAPPCPWSCSLSTTHGHRVRRRPTPVRSGRRQRWASSASCSWRMWRVMRQSGTRAPRAPRAALLVAAVGSIVLAGGLVAVNELDVGSYVTQSFSTHVRCFRDRLRLLERLDRSASCIRRSPVDLVRESRVLRALGNGREPCSPKSFG